MSVRIGKVVIDTIPTSPRWVLCFPFKSAILKEITRGKPMGGELLTFVCIGLVIAGILAVIAMLLVAWQEYKKTQKPPEK